MSSLAFATGHFPERPPRGSSRRARAVTRKPLRPASPAVAEPQQAPPVPPSGARSAWLPVSLVVLAHMALAWQLSRPVVSTPPKPPAPEIVLELTPPKPSEPVPPVIEPPKPLPQKIAVPRPQPPIPQPQPTQQAEPVPDAVAIAPAEPTPPPAPAAEPEARLSEPVGRVGHLNNPAPDYPATAVRQGWEGTVLLHVFVLANGQPQTVEVHQSSGRKLLDDAAVKTVHRWLFTPAKQGERSVDGWATVPIEFKLG